MLISFTDDCWKIPNGYTLSGAIKTTTTAITNFFLTHGNKKKNLRLDLTRGNKFYNIFNPVRTTLVHGNITLVSH